MFASTGSGGGGGVVAAAQGWVTAGSLGFLGIPVFFLCCVLLLLPTRLGTRVENIIPVNNLKSLWCVLVTPCCYGPQVSEYQLQGLGRDEHLVRQRL
jgi:hypothetical protein